MGGVPSAGSVDSNTITFGTIMPSISMVARASEKAPFAVAETGTLDAANQQAAVAGTYPSQFAANALGATPGGSPNGCGVFTDIPAANVDANYIGKLCGGLTNGQIQRATRGIASATVSGDGATVAATAPPLACIDSSVCFNDIIVPASAKAPGALIANNAEDGGLVGNSRCVRLCDPKGRLRFRGLALKPTRRGRQSTRQTGSVLSPPLPTSRRLLLAARGLVTGTPLPLPRLPWVASAVMLNTTPRTVLAGTLLTTGLSLPQSTALALRPPFRMALVPRTPAYRSGSFPTINSPPNSPVTLWPWKNLLGSCALFHQRVVSRVCRSM